MEVDQRSALQARGRLVTEFYSSSRQRPLFPPILEVRNGWDGIKFYNAHHIVLKRNFIHDNANEGILGNGHHVRIEGNVIAHNGFKADNEKSNKERGIYATGTDFEILNNVICSNRAYGIQVAAYPFKADSHVGAEFATARRWCIAHNTIAFQQNRAGIVVWQPDATDCVIENNIFYRNAVTLGRGDCQGIDFVTAGDRHIVRNNLFFGPGRTAIAGHSGGYTATANLEDKDPLCVDAERGDFHLREVPPQSIRPVPKAPSRPTSKTFSGLRARSATLGPLNTGRKSNEDEPKHQTNSREPGVDHRATDFRAESIAILVAANEVEGTCCRPRRLATSHARNRSTKYPCC
jgi:hypothetical protein